MSKRVQIVTSLFVGEAAECLPCHIETAFRRHLENPWVETVLVLTEAGHGRVERLCRELGGQDKFRIVATSERPTFARLFAAAGELLATKGGVAAVMNADISFGDEEAAGRAVAALLDTARSLPSCVFALTRRDFDGSAWRLCLHEEGGMPNFLSADCWMFATAPVVADDFPYCLGQMNCDLMANYDLIEAGYSVFNPCLDIAIHHHESDLKGLDYYVAESRKEDSQSRLRRFVIARGTPSYAVYGVPWVHSAWLEEGYRPRPYGIRSRKLFVALPPSISDVVLPFLFEADVFACRHGYDLVLLAEAGADHHAGTLLPDLRKNRNLYLVQLDGDFPSFAETLLRSGYHDSGTIAFASDFSFLTDDAAQTAEVLVIDARRIRSDAGWLPRRSLAGCTSEEFRFRHPGAGAAALPQLAEADQAVCSLITSVFRSDEFLRSFLANSRELDGYQDRIRHFFFLSSSSALERECLITHVAENPNSMLVWCRSDPGLYAIWNLGIRLARTAYVSNANVDDLRHPSQVAELTRVLDDHPEVVVAASALVPFESHTGSLGDIDTSDVWYAHWAGRFVFEDLFDLRTGTHGRLEMEPNNLPHCMPVWRRCVHEKHGLFDEASYGTFADWEFWLRVTRAGESGFLLPKPLSFYFINPGSHNRRGNKLSEYHARISGEYLPHAMARQPVHAGARSGLSLRHTVFSRKLNLLGRTSFFGSHRNSFNSIIECLDPLHLGPGGIDFLPFIERYFVWGSDPGEARSSDPKPLTRPWIGILHVPFDGPVWFEGQMRPESFFQTSLWQKSFERCKGLICLSEDLEYDLKQFYPDLPTLALKHPTSPAERTFDLNAYRKRPRVVQVGDWYRQLQAIYRIDACGHEKLVLMKQYTRNFMELEVAAIGDFRNRSVRELDFVGEQEYDHILSTSVVLCMLYGSAANNVVLECIARATPLIINPLPSVMEYLGEDYPLYATSLREVESRLLDRDRIAAAHDALVRRRNELDLSYDGFMRSLAFSPLYADL